MQIGRFMKALLVGAATSMWLVYSQPSLGRTVLCVLGAALVTRGWIALGAPRRGVPSAAAHGAAPDARHTRSADRRIERRPHGRSVRDVRCRAARRATARARRSTRR